MNKKTKKILNFDKKALEKTINSYFESCSKNETPITLTGLVLAIDTTKEILLNYPAKDEFFAIINRAKLRVEQAYEERLIKRGNSGDIFALRVLGWDDKKSNEQQESFIYNKMPEVKLNEKEIDFNVGESLENANSSNNA